MNKAIEPGRKSAQRCWSVFKIKHPVQTVYQNRQKKKSVKYIGYYLNQQNMKKSRKLGRKSTAREGKTMSQPEHSAAVSRGNEVPYEVVAALLNLETGCSDVMSTHHCVATVAAPALEQSMAF